MTRSYNRFSKDHRVLRSRHTDEWIIEAVNSSYGYWVVVRRNVSEEVAKLLLRMPEYTGEEYPVEAEYRRNMGLCG